MPATPWRPRALVAGQKHTYEMHMYHLHVSSERREAARGKKETRERERDVAASHPNCAIAHNSRVSLTRADARVGRVFSEPNASA